MADVEPNHREDPNENPERYKPDDLILDDPAPVVRTLVGVEHAELARLRAADGELTRLRAFIDELRNNRDRDIDNLIAENRDLRAAVARAEQATAEARRAEALCEKHSLRDEKDMLRIAEKLDAANGELEALAPVVTAAERLVAEMEGVREHNLSPAERALIRAMRALAADVPAAAIAEASRAMDDQLDRIDAAQTRMDALLTLRRDQCLNCAKPLYLATVPGGGQKWTHDDSGRWITGCADVPAAHSYLSTACHHGLHDQCGEGMRQRGETGLPHCKFCEAVCGCDCGHPGLEATP